MTMSARAGDAAGFSGLERRRRRSGRSVLLATDGVSHTESQLAAAFATITARLLDQEEL